MRPITPRPETLDEPRAVELEPLPPAHEEDDWEEVGRPEGPSGERFSWPPPTPAPRFEPAEEERAPVFEPAGEEAPSFEPEPASRQSVFDPEEPRPVDGSWQAEPQRPGFTAPPPTEAESERPATQSSTTPATPAPPAHPPTPAFGRRPGRLKR